MIAELAAAAAAAGGHSGGAAADAGVSIVGRVFTPSPVTVLAGESVRWTNQDAAVHTVTAADESFDSGRVAPGGSYERRFDVPGAVTYRCTIHRTMRGRVEVVALALGGPGVVRAGTTVRLEGRAPAGTPAVDLERIGAGVVADAVPQNDGRFAFTVVADRPAEYRARADGLTSAVVALRISPEVRLAARRGRRGVSVRVHAVGQPGARIVLARHERERFGYVRLAVARLDAHGRARMRLPTTRRLRLRARLVSPVGGYARAVSAVVVVARHGTSPGGDHHPAPAG